MPKRTFRFVCEYLLVCYLIVKGLLFRASTEREHGSFMGSVHYHGITHNLFLCWETLEYHHGMVCMGKKDLSEEQMKQMWMEMFFWVAENRPQWLAEVIARKKAMLRGTKSEALPLGETV